MRPGLLAFSSSSAFFGAALYINVVEQPARLSLDSISSIEEWSLSNRRGLILFSAIAITSAILAYSDYVISGDIRWIIGATIALAGLPYTYFVIVPVNIWLYVIPPDAPNSPARDLLRDWGLLEWGQTVIALAACAIFGWALAWPGEPRP